jgi:hypothetical protein
MSIAFKPDETFRGDYTYRNSPAAIRRFPFPFHQDQYMYSVNMEPHTKGPAGSVFENAFDIDEHYIAEMRDRAITLERDPGRCVSLPHMMDDHGIAVARLSGHVHAGQGRRALELDQQAAGHRADLHLRRRRHAALPALRVHHAAVPG